MPHAYDSPAWFALTAVLAAVSAVALAALEQLLPERRPVRRPFWHTGIPVAALAGLFAAGVGASVGLAGTAVASALFGVWLAHGRNLTRWSKLVSLSGSVLGLAVVLGGFARYLSSAQADVERLELCAAMFIGALIFATSAIVFCKLLGALQRDAMTRPGHDIANLFALLLCGWLGYGFVTEQARPFGFAALLAMCALACAMGVHLMISREYTQGQDHDSPALAFAARCHSLTLGRRGLLARIEWHGGEQQEWALREPGQGSMRNTAYAHRRGRHDSRRVDEPKRVRARYRAARVRI
ncbi:NADP transhydrogenase subunit beta [Paraburkholderia ginsengiterrae]|uniref:NADP transhydrogenase subunit beta n=1 Tax=Paraburkholderia ginsengiterrae TaxID=1462993 RepID=A0A1A9N408_9BURK|nr:NAD(P)(+) transhydrogenase (Re/Si-specific) subunit beta [Paraburkholderia ginsengiterrae]OAJ53144.1 NADP transhydrogenase subunit beta [Paraburkholderia ginsengiterrae]OAJ55843.1 NADP transhydrogenase subunit beta [Paraburkholderia ginsengiterrae]